MISINTHYYTCCTCLWQGYCLC